MLNIQGFNDFSKNIIENHKIRKTKMQKENFRKEVEEYLKNNDYNVNIESGRYLVTNHNIVVGNKSKAEIILAAHYDTPAALPVPNIIAPFNFVYTIISQVVIFIIFFLLFFFGGFLISKTEIPIYIIRIVFILMAAGLVYMVLAGSSNKNNYNDNTSGVVTLLEIAQSLPKDLRDKVLFIFFDNEEKMLLGSTMFVKNNKGSNIVKKPVFNFDCVGDGDDIFFITNKSMEKNSDAKSKEFLIKIKDILKSTNQKKKSQLVNTGFRIYPSDNMAFSNGIGVVALTKGNLIGHHLNHIHTKKDTNLNYDNIETLKNNVTKIIENM